METIQIAKLLVNDLVNPCGTAAAIRFRWLLESAINGQYQTAYRIIVSDACEAMEKNEGNMWDTGRVNSGDSINIAYDGKTLEQCRRYWWKVMVWDRDGKASEWSENACWDMGIGDFRGKWITEPHLAEKVSPITTKYKFSPYLRKEFCAGGKATRAIAYICGLGYYELYLNGKKAGDHVLDPAFSRYDKNAYYVAYDVTDMIKNQENVIGVILGNGFYNSYEQDNWNFKQAEWRDAPKLLFKLIVELDTGEKITVDSDESWETAQSPNTANNLMTGEVYDARLEQKGWNDLNFDASDWSKAKAIAPPGGNIIPQEMPPIRIVRELGPASVTKLDGNTKMVDFAENIVGYARIRVKGKAGTEVVMKYGERLTDTGYLDVGHIGGGTHVPGFQTDRYIVRGAQDYEEWQPMFTYHGFRYVQVEGIGDFEIKACVLNTDFEVNGGFDCSSELFRKIQGCIIKSSLGNFHSFPTDCPHREKNGWTGDGHLSAEQMLYNLNSKTAFVKWLRDFHDVQRINGQLPGIVPSPGWFYNWGSGPAWDSALVLVTWYLYEYCGDISVVSENYPSIVLYFKYISGRADNNLVSFGLGDWCHPGFPGHLSKCPTIMSDTAFYYVNAKLLSKMAKLLGKDEDYEKYNRKALEIRNAYRESFIDFENVKVLGDSQTALACAVFNEMLDPGEVGKFVDKLVEMIARNDNHIDCGIIGAKYILHVLTENGYHDVACKMALKTTYPSWGHWIMQGADTLWEDWEGQKSLNHHMFSSIGDWFYKRLAGINPDEESPGFKRIIIKPSVYSEIQYVNAWTNTPYGKVAVYWVVEGNTFKIKVSVPVNASAALYLPSKNGEYRIDGNVYPGKHTDGRVALSVPSGSYAIETDIFCR